MSTVHSTISIRYRCSSASVAESQSPYGGRNRRGKLRAVALDRAGLLEQLCPLLGRRQPRHRGVDLGVVSDRVAVGGDLGRRGVEVPLLDPDLEERRGHVLALENGQDLRRVRPGAIIERERDLAVLRPRDPDVRRVRKRSVDRGVLRPRLAGGQRRCTATGKLPNGREEPAVRLLNRRPWRRGTASREQNDPEHDEQRDSEDCRNRNGPAATMVRRIAPPPLASSGFEDAGWPRRVA